MTKCASEGEPEYQDDIGGSVLYLSTGRGRRRDGALLLLLGAHDDDGDERDGEHEGQEEGESGHHLLVGRGNVENLGNWL